MQHFFVPRTRIELALQKQEHGPQPCASTNSATWAIGRKIKKNISNTSILKKIFIYFVILR